MDRVCQALFNLGNIPKPMGFHKKALKWNMAKIIKLPRAKPKGGRKPSLGIGWIYKIR